MQEKSDSYQIKNFIYIEIVNENEEQIMSIFQFVLLLESINK